MGGKFDLGVRVIADIRAGHEPFTNRITSPLASSRPGQVRLPHFQASFAPRPGAPTKSKIIRNRQVNVSSQILTLGLTERIPLIGRCSSAFLLNTKRLKEQSFCDSGRTE